MAETAATDQVCRKCGAPLLMTLDGVYRGMLHCLDFCEQFGPGPHADPRARLRALIEHAETWAVASAITPQHGESISECFTEVRAALAEVDKADASELAAAHAVIREAQAELRGTDHSVSALRALFAFEVPPL